MRACKLSGNTSWPIVFTNDNAIIVIVDNHILKKYAIHEYTKEIEEVSTLVDWDALTSPNGFEVEAPKFYYNHGVIFSKNFVFNANKSYHTGLLMKMYSKGK